MTSSIACLWKGQESQDEQSAATLELIVTIVLGENLVSAEKDSTRCEFCSYVLGHSIIYYSQLVMFLLALPSRKFSHTLKHLVGNVATWLLV